MKFIIAALQKSLMLLIPPVLLLPGQVKMSVVKKKKKSLTHSLISELKTVSIQLEVGHGQLEPCHKENIFVLI